MVLKKQKRIALINDLTGFGRCSITVELPIISAMKIQACPLPTAILSAHTGFPSSYIDDYTDHMRPYMENWKTLDVNFDGICTGFLGSAKQIAIVVDFLKMFDSPMTQIMVDPVMGDYGKLYSSYTQEMCCEMKQLLAYADLVTPNLTEACNLLDVEYPEEGIVSDERLENMAKALSDKGPAKIVFTGLPHGDEIKNFIYERGVGSSVLCVKKIGGDRSGTGDAFAAIVGGSLVNGEGLQSAVRKAADFISKSLAYTVALNMPWNYGLCFEEYLTELK
jgi:pyridoxine kinase